MRCLATHGLKDVRGRGVAEVSIRLIDEAQRHWIRSGSHHACAIRRNTPACTGTHAIEYDHRSNGESGECADQSTSDFDGLMLDLAVLAKRPAQVRRNVNRAFVCLFEFRNMRGVCLVCSWRMSGGSKNKAQTNLDIVWLQM